MATHSFTDEQLLNLVNNTIANKTEFKVEDFTGGSVQVTSTNNHQLIKYRISLYFGYKGKNPISRTLDISEELIAIWQQALHLKVKFMQVSTNGMNYSELNALMNPPNIVVSNIVDSNIVVSKGIDTPLKDTLKVISQTEADAIYISKYLYSTIENFDHSFRGNHNNWIKDIEKAIRIDGRTKEQLKACIDWIYTAEKGSFWIPNILSGKKLRDKYSTMNMQGMNTKINPVDAMYQNGASATDLINQMEKNYAN